MHYSYLNQYIPKHICKVCVFARFVCMWVFDQGFFCVSSAVSGCHYLSQCTLLENEPGIRVGGRSRERSMQFAKCLPHNFSVGLSPAVRTAGTRCRIKVMTQLNLSEKLSLFTPTVSNDTV